MSAEGGNYVSRTAVAMAEATRRAEILRRNKRDIAADVLAAELHSGEPPAGMDVGMYRAVVGKLITKLRAG